MSRAESGLASPPRAAADLFLISLLTLFLELACIRWFPAHVLFLTFFTNIILLACFLGISVGCVAANRTQPLLTWTPLILFVVMGMAHAVDHWHSSMAEIVNVGNQQSPQLVFFGAEYSTPDPSRFFIPIEAVGGVFFLGVALAFIGPGQVLGHAFQRVPNRVRAYTLNILGSFLGIVLFAACSWLQLSPFWWFLPIVIGLGYFLKLHKAGSPPILRLFQVVVLLGVLRWAPLVILSDSREWNMSETFWSPYYAIKYNMLRHSLTVNLIAHQEMVPRHVNSNPAYAYPLPYVLNRDSAGRRFDEILIIGAGTGNDVSQALQWEPRRIDAVEIDPVILRLGRDFHSDRPYQDPRVTAHLDDGRNFLRSTRHRYDLVIYGLVDSLVLHSSYSDLRLESYLFTTQAFADVRRCLKPGGMFIMYNYFRQGWIVARIDRALAEVFGSEPLAISLPPRELVEAQTPGGFTIFFAGDTARLREAFQQHHNYWLRRFLAPGPQSPDGFAQNPNAVEQTHWRRIFLSRVVTPAKNQNISDDWPFLYLRGHMIPDLNVRAAGVMAGLAMLLLLSFFPLHRLRGARSGLDPRMFFLGAGFMLLETKAVVQMALLFGSTWMVNTVVFSAVLLMILAANLFVLKFLPQDLRLYYAALIIGLGLNVLIPPDFFLGLNRVWQVLGSCALTFLPVFFAGIIFAVSFGRSGEPDRDFGVNAAGAMFGGLAEYTSTLLGFRYLELVAVVFYTLSGVLYRPSVRDGPPQAAGLSAPPGSSVARDDLAERLPG